MTLAIPIQIWMVIVYVAIFTVVGLWSSRKVKELSHWALAGRNLPWWMIGPATGALMVAAAATIGAGGFAYKYGFSAIVMFTLAFIACFIVTSILMCPLYRRSGIWTMPDMFGRRYQTKAAFRMYIYIIVGAMVMFIGVESVGTARIFEAALFGGNHDYWTVSCILALLVIFASVAMGGVWAIAHTNIIHTAAMYIGLGLGLFYAYHTYGGYTALVASGNLGYQQIDVLAGLGAMSEVYLLFPLMYILAYLFIPFIHPNFVQISASGKDIKNVKWGFILGGIIGITITALCAILGIYVKAFMLGIFGTASEDLALPIFGMQINPVIGGLIYIGIISALMSTVGPFVVATSTILAVNVVGTLKKGNISSDATLKLGRIFTFILPVLSIFPALYWAPKIIPAISVIISFGAIVAPMFIAGFFWKRATGYGANASLIGGSLAFFAWVILRYPLGIHPIVPGMITATLALIIVSFATPPPKQRQLRFIQRLRGVQFEGESVLDEERAKKQETNQ